MTLRSCVSPPTAVPFPLAFTVAYDLFRRAAQFRRHALLTQADDAEDLRPQLWSNAEASILVLETILTGLIEDTGPDHLVALTESVTLLLDALTTTITSMIPPEGSVVAIANQLQRQCWLPHRPAVTLLQTLLVVVMTAVNDGALSMVVTLPRDGAETVVITVDSDAAGLAREAHAAARARLRDELSAIGGSLELERRVHHWRVQVCVPDVSQPT
ncbi:MAG TPA: hypothetical protein VFZ66_03535 [Herpetosiphonaceae bacterium]